MITDLIDQSHRYHHVSPRFAAAFEYLRNASADLPDGRYEIDGDRCFAVVQTYRSKPLTQAKFEVHRRYTDIQFIQSGAETILWAPLSTLTQVMQPYVPERDVAFFAHPPHSTSIHMRAGYFSVFFPEDGHAPSLENNGPSTVRKIVIKVEV